MDGEKAPENAGPLAPGPRWGGDGGAGPLHLPLQAAQRPVAGLATAGYWQPQRVGWGLDSARRPTCRRRASCALRSLEGPEGGLKRTH